MAALLATAIILAGIRCVRDMGYGYAIYKAGDSWEQGTRNGIKAGF